MDTQNTPIHIALWRKEFWFLAVANLLTNVGVYITVPQTIDFLRAIGYSDAKVATVMGIYAIGLFVFGPMVNFYVERYRRKHVCVYAMLFLMVALAATFYIRTTPYAADYACQLAIRFVLGAAFGLSQMVLLSTLVVDSVVSFLRTEANHHANWFGRFALSLGPLVGIVLMADGLPMAIGYAPVALVLIATLLIGTVTFPFKTPIDDVRRFGLDRFYLPGGTFLFINLLAVSVVLGMLLTLKLPPTFYAFIMAGFLLALLAERFVFANAELASETITGLGAIFVALLILLTRHHTEAVMISAALLGLGAGLIGSRFLLFFIKLSRHCQRGTSQSTFFLGWEGGVGLGLFVGLYFFNHQPQRLLECALLVTAGAMIFYKMFVHKWYMNHKNR